MDKINTYVYVRLCRPEGYEDVHPELLVEDAGIHADFRPEVVEVCTNQESDQLRADRDQQRADKLEMAAESERWAEEVGRLKADLVDARSQMLAVWNFLKPNASNDMEWVDEILTALHERDALLHDAQRDAERLMFAFQADGFRGLRKDRYDYAMDCAEDAGRDEPNAEDELNGVRRLIDAAMAAELEGRQ